MIWEYTLHDILGSSILWLKVYSLVTVCKNSGVGLRIFWVCDLARGLGGSRFRTCCPAWQPSLDLEFGRWKALHQKPLGVYTSYKQRVCQQKQSEQELFQDCHKEVAPGGCSTFVLEGWILGWQPASTSTTWRVRGAYF